MFTLRKRCPNTMFALGLVQNAPYRLLNVTTSVLPGPEARTDAGGVEKRCCVVPCRLTDKLPRTSSAALEIVESDVESLAIDQVCNSRKMPPPLDLLSGYTNHA